MNSIFSTATGSQRVKLTLVLWVHTALPASRAVAKLRWTFKLKWM